MERKLGAVIEFTISLSPFLNVAVNLSELNLADSSAKLSNPVVSFSYMFTPSENFFNNPNIDLWPADKSFIKGLNPSMVYPFLTISLAAYSKTIGFISIPMSLNTKEISLKSFSESDLFVFILFIIPSRKFKFVLATGILTFTLPLISEENHEAEVLLKFSCHSDTIWRVNDCLLVYIILETLLPFGPFFKKVINLICWLEKA